MRAFAHLIATAGPVGAVPIAPGTAGSVVGVALFVGLRALGAVPVDLVALAAVLALGVWSAGVVERDLGRTDPGAVVIDEVAGMLVTLMWVPVGWVGVVFGFLAFRVFDIIKPFPARTAERLPGGWGIMTDDVVAGIHAQIVVRLALWIAPGIMGA
jgi:phosphatidylglycerophosphatase A